jgi:hypothetical protein
LTLQEARVCCSRVPPQFVTVGARAAVLLLAAVGCKTDPPDLAFMCSESRECPDGFWCDQRLALCINSSLRPQLADDGGPAADSGGAGGPPAAGDGEPAAGEGGSAGRASAGRGSPTDGGRGSAGRGPAADGGRTSAGTAAPPSPVCAPGEQQCQAEKLRLCKADGSGWDEQVCASGCNSDRLECNACVPDLASCSNSRQLKCRSDGSQEDAMICDSGCRSDRPECMSCTAAQHVCDGKCLDPDDPSGCGDKCLVCGEAPNARAVCSAGSCSIACDDGALLCHNAGFGCAPGSWGFEEGIANWRGPNDNSDDGAAPANKLETTTIRAHSGKHSASTAVAVSGMRNRWRLFLAPCDPKGLDVQGREYEAWFYIESPADLTGHGCALVGANSEADTRFETEGWLPVAANKWSVVRVSASGPAAASLTSLHLDCRLDSSYAWNGRVYVDDVALK